jgi:hypothetical protein
MPKATSGCDENPALEPCLTDVGSTLPFRRAGLTGARRNGPAAPQEDRKAIDKIV